MRLMFLLALGAVSAMVCGCSAWGRTVFEFRVTYAETGEPVVGACVSTERISDRSPAPEAQGNSDSDGSVTAVHWFVLNPLTRQPHRSPMLVRIDGPEAHEDIEVNWATGAIGTGDIFQVELISYTSDRILDDIPDRGCDLCRQVRTCHCICVTELPLPVSL